MTSSAHKRYTVDEYLALEETAEVRHEYFDGEIFAMAGGTVAHDLISANIACQCDDSVKPPRGLTLPNQWIIRCPSGLLTHPDITMTCLKPDFNDPCRIVVSNPQVVVEVMINETEAYDRGRKFHHYMTIPTLQEYLVIASDRPCAEHFARMSDGRWLNTSYSALNEEIAFPALDCSVAMAEVYANVEFPKPGETETTPQETQP